MTGQKFTLVQMSIQSVLGMIEAQKFVIPEIQRPFVWEKSQVRDLVDSLYNGYPTGYIITWKNPDIKTKDGGTANGNEMLIDGQQRITAMMAAFSGLEVLNKDFETERVKISFNPFAKDNEKKFEVQNASILKNKKWIPDISVLFDPTFDIFGYTLKYCEDNPEMNPTEFSKIILSVKAIETREIGVISLDHSLDIDEVTEIFIRINSKGTPLSQSDFVMSKMAADEVHGGSMMRKAIDYFSHLVVKPEFYSNLNHDKEFMESKYADKLKWLAHDYDDIYDPNFGDMIRVSFMHKFGRGKLSDLVSLLSGRDFITKEFKEEIVEESYEKMDEGILNFMNKYNFTQFVMAIKGAGFSSSKLIKSQMALNFAYCLYLMLLSEPDIPNEQIKRYVQKWFVMSILTRRYSGSTESQMDRDMRNISEKGFLEYFKDVEESNLSDTFWNITLPQELETSSLSSPGFNVFVAAQVNRNSNSMLMNGLKVTDILSMNGAADVHHIFPKAYLIKNGIDLKTKYNQVANYIYLDTQVNKAISDDAPNEYFGKVFKQCDTKEINIGNITDIDLLKTNLKENCIPEGTESMTFENFDEFLTKRRMLMAKFIEEYYKNL